MWKSLKEPLQHENAEKQRHTKVLIDDHVKKYPELYRSDVSIYPSYTGLNNLPYYIICRRRVQKRNKQMTRQFNRELRHMAMMQSHALASVRIDRIFSVGFPPDAANIPDFATTNERRRINKLLN